MPGNASATVSWKAPSTNGGSAIAMYTVTASPGGAAVMSATTHATIHGLRNGTAYTFEVTAANAIGTGIASPASSPVIPAAVHRTPTAASSSVAAATVPGAPTGVSGEPRASAVTVSWTAPSNGGSPITSYTVTTSPGGTTDTVSASATSYEVFGLTNGTAYTFTVTATNAVGAGPASAPSAPVTPEPATAPGPVTDVTATAGNTQATLSWQMPANDGGADLVETFVEVYAAATGSSAGYVDVAAPATTATITGLTDGTAYYAAVIVENRSYYASNPVDSAQFTPQAGPQPAPPASVSAQPGNTQATVTTRSLRSRDPVNLRASTSAPKPAERSPYSALCSCLACGVHSRCVISLGLEISAQSRRYASLRLRIP